MVWMWTLIVIGVIAYVVIVVGIVNYVAWNGKQYPNVDQDRGNSSQEGD